MNRMFKACSSVALLLSAVLLSACSSGGKPENPYAPSDNVPSGNGTDAGAASDAGSWSDAGADDASDAEWPDGWTDDGGASEADAGGTPISDAGGAPPVHYDAGKPYDAGYQPPYQPPGGGGSSSGGW